MKTHPEIFEPMDLELIQEIERESQSNQWEEYSKKYHLEIEDVPTFDDIFPNKPIFDELILNWSIEPTYNDD